MSVTAVLKIYCLTLSACVSLNGQDSRPQSAGVMARHEQTSQPSDRTRVPQDEAQKLLVRRVLPHYPQEAREKRVQGDVVLRLTISPEGNVGDVGVVSGDPLLAPAAVGAVKLWKYRPFMLNGQAIEIETQALVNFKLETAEDPGEVSSPDIHPTAEGGIAGDSPGGIPNGQTDRMISGIISSPPPAMPRVAVPERVRVSSGVSNALCVKRVQPAYPLEARRGRIQGSVVMHAIIDKSGDIATIEVVSGHSLLAPAAIDAAKQWKYKPYLLHGKPVEVDTQIVVNFVLSGD